MPVSISGTNGVTFPDSSLQAAAASPYVLKNRIINGDMKIDQRNAGASVTPTDGQYTLDRWEARLVASAKYSVQQSTVTPSSGFKNSLLITSLAATAVGASDYYFLSQKIEGLNTYDLNWGTANAQTITLSFWVRSSLTGTFSGVLQNSGSTRSYPFSYTISAANTWEYKTITVAGDTSGTWLTTNGIGIALRLNLGAGSNLVDTAGAWVSADEVGATGSVNLVSTNGATFYITGVQLEQNTTATPFERRLYNQELANCQRYCHVYFPGASGTLGLNSAITSTTGRLVLPFPVTTRIAPTGITISAASDFASLNTSSGTVNLTGLTFSDASQYAGNLALTVGTASFTAGGASYVFANSANSKIIFNGCEL